jgi:hypothetical protein
MSTLGHASKSRVARNVVTSYEDSSAKAMGKKKITPHDQRYEEAHEYVDLMYSSVPPIHPNLNSDILDYGNNHGKTGLKSGTLRPVPTTRTRSTRLISTEDTTVLQHTNRLTHRLKGPPSCFKLVHRKRGKHLEQNTPKLSSSVAEHLQE